METAEKAVNEELLKLQQGGISQRELDKVKNNARKDSDQY